jgi:hypothetical protein
MVPAHDMMVGTMRLAHDMMVVTISQNCMVHGRCFLNNQNDS